MLNIFRKKNKTIDQTGTFQLTTDMHSHILPGIDDGAPDINASLKLIRGLYDIGFRKLIATPHIIGDLYRNNAETISGALEKVQSACANAGIEIAISAAAEYMLDDYFMDLLNKKIPLLRLHNNLVLTEFSYNTIPQNIDEITFSMITEGYQPVLAHPERYAYFHKNFKDYARLKEMGFHLQVNLLSLTGYYGNTVTKAAKYILDHNLADLVGTDLHHGRHLAVLQNIDNRQLLNKYLSQKKYNDFDALSL